MGHKTAFRRVFPHVSASFSTFPTVVGNFEAAWWQLLKWSRIILGPQSTDGAAAAAAAASINVNRKAASRPGP